MAESKSDEIDLDEEQPPLPKMSCKTTDCVNNLHCFQQDKQDSQPVHGGKCRECGVELVDWQRVHKRSTLDAEFTSLMLRFEWIRHKYWHHPLTQQERNYALKKGRSEMRIAAEKRIRQSVGPEEPFHDGWQTPWEGKGRTSAILYYAQHATACCCRTCIAEWHGIPAGQQLSDDEIAYLADLLCIYVIERLPELTQDGVHIPSIRRSQVSLGG